MITTYKETESRLRDFQDRLDAVLDNLDACADASDYSGAFILPLNALRREKEWLEWLLKEIADTSQTEEKSTLEPAKPRINTTFFTQEEPPTH